MVSIILSSVKEARLLAPLYPPDKDCRPGAADMTISSVTIGYFAAFIMPMCDQASDLKPFLTYYPGTMK